MSLLLWRSPGFAAWYHALRKAGHRLEDAQLEWSYRSRAAGRPPLLWHCVRAYSSSESVVTRAAKSSSVVTDVSASVLYYPDDSGDVLDTLVVLVREYRSAVRNRLALA